MEELKQYEPIMERMDKLIGDEIEPGITRTIQMCAICQSFIRECPFWRVSRPVYCGDAYYSDFLDYACSLEHAQELYKKGSIQDSAFKKMRNNPSEGGRDPWIFAFHDKRDYPRDTPRSGKWVPFIEQSKIDALWQVLVEILHQGKLGRIAKVATRATKDTWDKGLMKHVICIYTYDYEDAADVRRVRQALRELGITWKIAYKADEDTESGRYASNTSGRVSKYYE